MTTLFEPGDLADISRLIADHPLAWVVSRNFHSSPLPLLAETGADGQVLALFGHCARRNPLVADFRGSARADPFNGPHGYVSPALVSKPDWAPTWNYAVLRFTVDIELVAHETDDAIRRLVDRMEGDRWSTDRVGARYGRCSIRSLPSGACRHGRTWLQTRTGRKSGQFCRDCCGHPDRMLAAWMEEQARP
jgi:transcriptional regulator